NRRLARACERAGVAVYRRKRDLLADHPPEDLTALLGPRPAPAGGHHPVTPPQRLPAFDGALLAAMLPRLADLDQAGAPLPPPACWPSWPPGPPGEPAGPRPTGRRQRRRARVRPSKAGRITASTRSSAATASLKARSACTEGSSASASRMRPDQSTLSASSRPPGRTRGTSSCQ